MFALLALMPSLLTMLAVLCTLTMLPLYWARLEAPMAPSYPALDWAALEEELDVDAGWEAVYVATMGCNRVARCSARAPRRLVLSMTRRPRHTRRAARVNAPQCRTMHTPEQNVGQRGPPPPAGARAGKSSLSITKTDI